MLGAVNSTQISAVWSLKMNSSSSICDVSRPAIVTSRPTKAWGSDKICATVVMSGPGVVGFPTSLSLQPTSRVTGKNRRANLRDWPGFNLERDLFSFASKGAPGCSAARVKVMSAPVVRSSSCGWQPIDLRAHGAKDSKLCSSLLMSESRVSDTRASITRLFNSYGSVPRS